VDTAEASDLAVFMDWIVLSLISAIFLGFYDLSKKHALKDNAVLPVLFLSTVVGAAVWALLFALQRFAPGSLPAQLHTEALTGRHHLFLAAKSAIVGASWIFSYFGVKHLPVSLASPIRATGPLWTFVGALLILGERPNWIEILGIGTTLVSFMGLSLAGRKEGIHFHKDKWVGYMVAGTLLGTVSALYDKFLLGSMHFKASTVQAWFSFYLVLVFLPFAIGWKLRWWPRNVFHWKWSIPLIALTLLVADFVYFSALRHPEAMISLVSSLRRASTLIAFAGGILLFKEKNAVHKLPAVIGVLIGITLTVLG
jgi:bacterial/archaeal transporter family protein